jgi:hypothetical protein
VWVPLELGRAERGADRHAEAIEQLREAVRLAADPLTRCDAVISLGLSVGAAPDRNREFIPLVTAALDDAAELDGERRLMLKSALYNSWSLKGPRAAEIETEFAALAGDTQAECIALAQLVDQRKAATGAAEGRRSRNGRPSTRASCSMPADTPRGFTAWPGRRAGQIGSITPTA